MERFIEIFLIELHKGKFLENHHLRGRMIAYIETLILISKDKCETEKQIREQKETEEFLKGLFEEMDSKKINQ